MDHGLIVHEWIAPRGGSENVVDRLMQAFPDAELLCLWDETRGARYAGRTVHETWLARSPLWHSKAVALPFMPSTWRDRHDGDFDWILASSHLFAHHVTEHDRRVPKIAYVHTPARYVWAPQYDARGRTPQARAAAPMLKRLDRRRARELDGVIANSAFVRDRIEEAWQRDADVVHPPVEVARIQQATWRGQLTEDELLALDALPDCFVLGASRFVEYKRLDAVIEAAALAGLPAVIAGAGPLEASLRQFATEVGVPVTFVVAPSTPLLYALYEAAAVFVFPAVEDFGIMPVEAIASGTAVVANPDGGTHESVELTGGGTLSEDDSPRGFAAAILSAVDLDMARPRERARHFDAAAFDARITAAVDGAVKHAA
ncbi:glycosyltransferase [Demequina iriomotensis]|uniref:glycosyltransferase n=1 Tax=Demequina iriomotensis TaxID=1536641 RepID=UPI000780E778|nr:glycosyltransferase [Demequina iriomotensis]